MPWQNVESLWHGLSVGLSFKFEVLLALRLAWGFSSAGRAPALQAGGHRFDPDKLHHHPRVIGSGFLENVILVRKTQIAWGFGLSPVLIHRKEKILSGGFQV